MLHEILSASRNPQEITPWDEPMIISSHRRSDDVVGIRENRMRMRPLTSRKIAHVFMRKLSHASFA